MNVSMSVLGYRALAMSQRSLTHSIHGSIQVRGFSHCNCLLAEPAKREPILLVSTTNGVTTIQMNTPKRLNAWTAPMMLGLRKEFAERGADPDTKILILTGADPYYCAGVDLADTIKPMHPKSLFDMIVKNNQALFDIFLDFPKPIIAAVNGPAIGASVTSATLCDAIVASDKATFHTPFAALGIPPEGCSSVHFERIMGQENALKMLEQGWKPTAVEAKEAGFVKEVVEHDDVMKAAQALAEDWIKQGKQRSLAEQGLVQEMKAVNAKESVDLATAFLSSPFLMAQHEFLKKKGKSKPAALFWTLNFLRPLWSRLL